MKIFYLSRAQIPNNKAHVLQIHKMCDAFRQAGASVELFHPKEPGAYPDPEKAKERYGLNDAPTYRTIPCLNIKWLRNNTRRLGFLIYASTYCFMATLFLLYGVLRSDEDVAIYSRDRLFSYLLLYLKPLLRLPVFLEVHEFPNSLHEGTTNSLIKRSDGIVVISRALKDDLVDADIPSEKIIVKPDAADAEAFSLERSKHQLREELDLPVEEPLVGFTGNLYSYNGPELLLSLASQASDLRFVVVGGSEDQLRQFRKRKQTMGLNNLQFEGHQPHEKIPRYLKAFDVLLLPLQPEINRTLKYCSPLKLFEYLMAGRPIVASDLPSLNEILEDRNNALLVDPENPKEYLTALKTILDDQQLADELSCNAAKTGERYTWKRRAREIVEFMEESLTNDAVT